MHRTSALLHGKNLIIDQLKYLVLIQNFLSLGKQATNPGITMQYQRLYNHTATHNYMKHEKEGNSKAGEDNDVMNLTF
jgi:hypothetical protein